MEASRIKRVEEMEAILNRWNGLAEEGEKLLEAMEKAMPELERLVAYYSSPDWNKDYYASDAGEFPEDLPQGVLSQDAVFDLLTLLRGLVLMAQSMNLRIARIP